MFTAMAVKTHWRWAFSCPRVAVAALTRSMGELVHGARPEDGSKTTPFLEGDVECLLNGG